MKESGKTPQGSVVDVPTPTPSELGEAGVAPGRKPAVPDLTPRESPIPQGQLPDQNLERTKAADRIAQLEAERDGWENRAESSEHNFGVLHDELAAMRHERDDPIAAAMGRAAPTAPGDLTKLLNEGVDDYWITLTGNRALVERLRAAAPAAPERAAPARMLQICRSLLDDGMWRSYDRREDVRDVKEFLDTMLAAAPAAPRESPIPQGQLPDQNLERTKAAAPKEDV